MRSIEMTYFIRTCKLNSVILCNTEDTVLCHRYNNLSFSCSHYFRRLTITNVTNLQSLSHNHVTLTLAIIAVLFHSLPLLTITNTPHGQHTSLFLPDCDAADISVYSCLVLYNCTLASNVLLTHRYMRCFFSYCHILLSLFNFLLP